MVADIIELRRRPGRPSPERLAIANDHLRAEVRSMRVERQEDVDAIRPAANRLAMVAREFGPEALSAALSILARLERMERRGMRPGDAA